jgi:ubiquinone/menaquinone biosynthesis C-methylase UbiE
VFKKGNAHQLPFAENTFDAVISECTVCILEKEKAIKEMARVVKPNGYVGFHDICWKRDTPERMKTRLAEIEDEKPETLEGWKALCEKAGLTEVQTIDRSTLIPVWMKETTSHLSLATMAKILIKVVRMWGLSGLMDVWESEQIFQSKYTGYGIIVGRKPGSSSLT